MTWWHPTTVAGGDAEGIIWLLVGKEVVRYGGIKEENDRW
jgi:hypothetical protein